MPAGVIIGLLSNTYTHLLGILAMRNWFFNVEENSLNSTTS